MPDLVAGIVVIPIREEGVVMVKTISTTEARANFGDVVNGVYYTKEPILLEKKGKVIAVIVSPDLFDRLQQEDAQDWATIQAVGARQADRDPDAILAEITAEVKAVRKELSARRRAS